MSRLIAPVYTFLVPASCYFMCKDWNLADSISGVSILPDIHFGRIDNTAVTELRQIFEFQQCPALSIFITLTNDKASVPINCTLVFLTDKGILNIFGILTCLCHRVNDNRVDTFL